MSTTPCPHCGTTARQSRADGRCVSCGKQLPEALRATGADVVGTAARRPARIDLPPAHQTYELEVGCAEFLARQTALPLAAARAVACLPPENFAGLQLFLINNTADADNDGWLRFSGHRDQEAIVFFELVATRIRRWFRKPTYQVAMTAYLPPGSLNEVIGLIQDGSGLEEWEKQRDGREAMGVFAAEVGQPVISHAPGSRLVVG